MMHKILKGIEMFSYFLTQFGVLATMKKKISKITAMIALVAFLLSGCAPAIERFEVDADDDPFIGPAQAPVEIIIFEDYQCPFCKAFTQETLPLLKQNYVDSQKAKIVIRDYPVVEKHPEAMISALALGCALEQQKYWQYHDIVFENQQQLTHDHLIHYAKILQLNEEMFTDCLETEQFREEIYKDISDAHNAGVRGTPTLFVNGRKIEGAQPYDVIEKIIEEELQ